MHQEPLVHHKHGKSRRINKDLLQDKDIILLPSDYSLVVTTICLYSNLVVDLTRWRCIHSLDYQPCLVNTVKSDCKAIHYGFCVPIDSVVSIPNGTSSEEDEDYSILLSNSIESKVDHRFKTATKAVSKPSTKSSSSSSSSATVVKPSSPTLSDCAAIQLLAEDVEGKLETLLKTFVSEEKVRQEARLNLLNKKSSSLSSLNSDSSSLSSSPTSTPNSPEFSNSEPGHRLVSQISSHGSASKLSSSSPIKQTGTLSSSRQRSHSPSKQWNQSGRQDNLGINSLNSPTRQGVVNCDQNKSSMAAETHQENNVNSSRTKMASNKSSQFAKTASLSNHSAEGRDVSPSRMVFGLHEKSPKSKYMHLLSDRSGFTQLGSSVGPAEKNSASTSRNSTTAVSKCASGPLNVASNLSKFGNRAESSSKLCQQRANSMSSSKNEQNDEKASTVEGVQQKPNSKGPEKQEEELRTRAEELEPKVERSSKSGLEKREPRIIVEPSRDYNFSSPVDYAKRRFINGNINTAAGWGISEKPTRSLVTETRTKFEKGLLSNGPLVNLENGSRQTYNNGHHNLLKTVETVETESGHPLHFHHHHHHRHNPVTPFLTKGSVAERVLLFEKRPEIRKEKEKSKGDSENECVAKRSKSPALYSTWRNQDKTQNEVANIARTFGPTTNGKRSIGSNRSNSSAGSDIPKFYYPSGRPLTPTEIENQIKAIQLEFDKLEDGLATRETFGRIVKVCKLPLYWKEPFFLYACGSQNPNFGLSFQTFIEQWKKLLTSSFDDCSKFVKILTMGRRNFLLPEDFVALLQDVIDTHPGLTFLKEAIEFHSRYIHTVIARIYYCTNQSWSGKITIPELRKSNFLVVLAALEEEEDINQITDYFSYEHFYVIYCKFWELDKDHDLIIDKYDLSRHNDGAISSRMVNRIFSGAVTRGPARKQTKMTYSEFVWFLLSEEDKKHPRSVEYWFRCMDIDGDGYLSMYELEYFYEEQVKRMEAIGIEALPFSDCLCQMLDMIRPKLPCKISLSDLKNCRMSFVFFDTFFNLDKYLDFEQRDPFASKEQEENMVSDWDRFAAEEYEILVAEESAQSVRNPTVDNVKELRNSNKSQVSAFTVASKKYGLQTGLVDQGEDDEDEDEDDYAETDADYSY